jgi:cation:H+ antiporter
VPLIYSAEKLIGHLVGIATGLRGSVFLPAVVFTGIEFDDIVLGVALNLEDLDEVAGTALSMTGVVLAPAALLTPTKVNIPRDYVVVPAAASLLMIPFTFMAPLTPVQDVILLALAVLFFAYVVARESRAGTPIFRDAEIYEEHAAARAPGGTATAVRGSSGGDGDLPAKPAGQDVADSMPLGEVGRRSGWARIGPAVLALAGLVIGAATTGIGTEGILETHGLEGTSWAPRSPRPC